MPRCLLAILFALALLGVQASAADAPVHIERTFLLDAPAGHGVESPDFAALASAPAREVASVDEPRLSLDHPTWFKLQLMRSAEDGQRRWLDLKAATQWEVDAYLWADGQLVAQARGGIHGHPADRACTTTDVKLPLQGWHGPVATVYLRIQPTQHIGLYPEIHNEQGLWEDDQLIRLVSPIYLGAAFILLLLRATLFISLRDAASRDYLLFAAVMMVIAIVRTGYLDRLVQPWPTAYSLAATISCLKSINTFLALRCFESIFELHRHLPRLSRLNRYFRAVIVIELLVSVGLSATAFNDVTALTQLTVVLFGFVLCAVAIGQRLPAARIVTLGWLGIFLAGTILCLKSLGVLPKLPYLPMIAIAGIMWEMTINTIALVYRFKRLNESHHLAEIRQVEISSLRRLVRILCHDVSAPTAVVGMTTDLMKQSLQDGQPVELEPNIERLNGAAKSLNGIVDAVRQHERLKMQGGRVEVTPTDLVHAWSDVEELLRDSLANKRLSVAWPFPPQKAEVLAEPTLLRSTVLGNALTNAIKFSQPGGVIEVSLAREDNGRTVRLEIRDHGIGMPAALRHEFQVSGHIDSRPGTQGESGTGFGVQLMREFTLAMGGSIEIDSATDEEAHGRSGTTVRFRFRAAPAA